MIMLDTIAKLHTYVKQFCLSLPYLTHSDTQALIHNCQTLAQFNLTKPNSTKSKQTP